MVCYGRGDFRSENMAMEVVLTWVRMESILEHIDLGGFLELLH